MFLKAVVFLGVVGSGSVALAQVADTVAYWNKADLFLDWFSCNASQYDERPTRSLSLQMNRWDNELFLPADSSESIPMSIFGIGALRDVPGIDTLFTEMDMLQMQRTYVTIREANLRRAPQCMKMRKRLRKAYYWYQLPLFSNDGSTVLFAYGYRCGRLCGHGATVICRKRADGDWQFIRSLAGWIS